MRRTADTGEIGATPCARVKEAKRACCGGRASGASARQRFQPRRARDRRHYSSVVVARGILLTPAVRPTQGTGDGDRLLGDRAQVAADLLVPSPCPARMRLHAEFTVLAHPPRTPARPLLSVIHRASCPPGVLPQNVTPTCSYSSTQPPSSPSQKSPVPSTPSGHAVDKVVAEGGHSRHTSLMRMFLGGFVGASAPPLFYHNKPYEKKRGAAAGVCVLTCASRCKLPENLRRFSLILRHNYHRTCAALTSALCSDGRTSDHALQEVC